MSYDNSHSTGLVIGVTAKLKTKAAIDTVKQKASDLTTKTIGNTQVAKDNTCGFLKGLWQGLKS